MAFIGHDNRVHSSLSEINVTPLVDVMLVLLIIFMITAPILQTGIQVRLPRTASVEKIPVRPDTVIVTIDKQGNVYVGTGSKAAHVPVNVNDLQSKLSDLISTSEDRRVYVRADGDTPYRVVAYVLALCKQAGATVSLVTDIEK